MQMVGKIISIFDISIEVVLSSDNVKVGDILEIIIPGTIDVHRFEIDRLWDYETGEEIDTVSPGKAGQKVRIRLPIKCEKDWIIRRSKHPILGENEDEGI